MENIAPVQLSLKFQKIIAYFTNKQCLDISQILFQMLRGK